jgi:hypothetical protein
MFMPAADAPAHVVRTSGPYQIEMGWNNEPPFAGEENSVDVRVSNLSGVPVTVPRGALRVEVLHGIGGVTLPLVPETLPGELHARFAPPSAGVYLFRVIGVLGSQKIDLTAGCSESTFECVRASTGEGSEPFSPAALAGTLLALGVASSVVIVIWGRRRSLH